MPDQHAPAPSAGLYLFCVAPSSDPVLDCLRGGEGIAPGTALEAVRHEDLLAVACAVPLEEWTGPGSEDRLRDLGWLGPRALRHEAVIESVQAQAPVLPLRFGCLFSSDAEVRRWLAAHGARIAAFLSEIAARAEEWTLKGWLDAEHATAARLASDERWKALPVAPGARYLREQKLRQEIERTVRSWARGLGEQGVQELSALGTEARALRLPGSPSPSGRNEEAVFNYALLVPRSAVAEFKDRVETLHRAMSEQGVSLDLTGPWPLYSFCPQLTDAAAPQDPSDDAAADGAPRG